MRARGLNGLDVGQRYVVERADAEGEIERRLPTQSTTASPTDGLEREHGSGQPGGHGRHCSIIDAAGQWAAGEQRAR